MIKHLVYWDSCTFIDWIENTKKDRIACLEPVVDAAQNEHLLIVTSTITIGEVVKLNNSDPNPLPKDDEIKIVKFFRNSFIQVRPVDRKIAEIARGIIRSSFDGPRRLKLPDAIHIATAIACKVHAVQTFDDKDLSKHHLHHGNPPIPIGRIYDRLASEKTNLSVAKADIPNLFS